MLGNMMDGYLDKYRCKDTVVVDVTDGGVNVLVFTNKPTAKEIAQFKSEADMKVKLVSLQNVIFFLFKFGKLPWMDAPYSVYLSRNLSRLECPSSEELGYAMILTLIDSYSGEIVSNRLIGLSHKVSVKLFDMIQEQCKKPFNQVEYNAAIRDVYSRYSTKALVKLAGY